MRCLRWMNMMPKKARASNYNADGRLLHKAGMPRRVVLPGFSFPEAPTFSEASVCKGSRGCFHAERTSAAQSARPAGPKMAKGSFSQGGTIDDWEVPQAVRGAGAGRGACGSCPRASGSVRRLSGQQLLRVSLQLPAAVERWGPPFLPLACATGDAPTFLR